MINKDDELLNKIDNAIKKLEQEQKIYIEKEGVKLFFKNIKKVDIIKTQNNTLKLQYHSHDVKEPDYNYGEIDIHTHVKLMCNDMINNIKNIERTVIIKELTLSYNIEINNIFLDENISNNFIEEYINNYLTIKYKNFKIKNKEKIENENTKLYHLEIEEATKTYYEYFLIYNIFFINFTIDNHCNHIMNKVISEMLLSCSLTEEILEENKYLNISKNTLDKAFEIEENQNSQVENQIENQISDENIIQFNKLKNLLNNYPKLNNDKNFITQSAFNILLLGNATAEQNLLLDSIIELFKQSTLKESKFNLYSLDIKKDINTQTSLEKIIKNKIELSNFLIINNFDYIEKLELEAQKTLINTITNLENFISIIITGDEKRTLNILEKNNELLNKFSYTFKCKDYSISKMYQTLLLKLYETNYKINFNEEAKTIIDQLSQKSYLKNEAFINSLYTKMLKYVLENNLDEFNMLSFPKVTEEASLNNALNELNNLIGLNNVKKQVHTLISFWKFKKQTNNINNQYLNMFLIGSPGTGKTTIAKILKQILYALNYIDEDKIIEITPNDLIADYEGQTKTKTREILKEAKGGVLFIDEAYLFLSAQSYESNYFKEALVELLKYMENPNNVVILAGYSSMMENVLKLNKGLKSRVAHFIDFENYTEEELIQILVLKLKKQNISITNDALNKIRPILNKKIQEKDFGNGRYIDKLITKILMKHAENVEINNQNLLTITKEDINEQEILNDKIKKENNFGFIQGREDE